MATNSLPNKHTMNQVNALGAWEAR